MQKNPTQLPEHYREILQIDLQKNKKLALLVNGLALIIAAAMFIPAACRVPLSTFFETTELGLYFAKLGALLAGMVLYLVLHELVHGICMRAFSGVRPHYGFTGLYAYAGSSAYFGKKPYIVIALAPIVVWGAVLAILNLLVPASWFWPVYFIQIINVSGAAGDLYVTCRLGKLPPDILVRDSGVSMTVYSSR